MYGCESWTIKRAGRQIDAFRLWWRRLLRVAWAARRSNQSILKEINPEYSLEELILKLKLQYFGHLMQSANSLEKILDAGKDWRQEEKGMTEDKMGWWHHWLNVHEFEKAPRDGEGQGGLARCCPWGHQESDMTEQLNSNNKKKRMHHSEEKWRKWRTVSWSDTPRNSEFMMKYSAMWIKSQKRQLPSSPDIFLYVVHITSPLYFLSGLCFVLLIFKERWNRKWYLKPNIGYVLVATVSYVFFLVGKCLKQLTDISHVFAFSGSQDYWVHLEIILTW